MAGGCLKMRLHQSDAGCMAIDEAALVLTSSLLATDRGGELQSDWRV